MNREETPEKIGLIVNGIKQTVTPNKHLHLLAYLRNELRLVGTKQGCATGNCGACTVLVDDTATQSCQYSLSAAADSDIKTIEHISQTALGSNITNSLIKHDAAQCGYCLPGIVMTAFAELSNDSQFNSTEALHRNLCRCGTHTRIIKALDEIYTNDDATK